MTRKNELEEAADTSKELWRPENDIDPYFAGFLEGAHFERQRILKLLRGDGYDDTVDWLEKELSK